MSGVVSTLRAATAMTVLAPVFVPAPAVADPAAVDPDTGPVAYANAASLAVTDDGYGARGGSVISETQRSPVTPGSSRLGPARSAVPGSDGERAAVGPHYRLAIEGHDVTATLRERRVPAAEARADFVLTDRAAEAEPVVLSFESSVTAVECSSAEDVTAEATAARLSMLDADGDLTPVEPPRAGDEVRRRDLPFGPPGEIADDERATSDITVRRVDDYEQLLRQDQWRDGDVTAASGWLVEIDTHVWRADGDGSGLLDLPGLGHAGDTENAEDAESAPVRTIETTLVLGGVSCSVPSGFVRHGGGGAEPGAPAPSVPVTIPAGAGAPVEARSAGTDTGTGPSGASGAWWGAALLGAGALFGGAALVLARRASSVRDGS
ncbi:hypothetical protein B1813_22115 [Saccharomonospora piscinae]|uniref:Htaa protein n=1 Tax=Saccharomonospora piscinae TaxID=687388 RepID=A0A1V8ZXI5_SACPI|nr:hypothetical protein [Saccharomonospora piscinae]OQO89615.1 hypothetical protein B1813_22115 [Saccharomonospora piscinae]